MPSLIHIIEELKDLKELYLDKIEADFGGHFEESFKALGKKSNTLEVLEIDLKECKIMKWKLDALVETLPQLKCLQRLKLSNFVIEAPEFFQGFAETIHRCSRLESLTVSGYKVEFSFIWMFGDDDDNEENWALIYSRRQDYQKMFERIFQKTNLVEINFKGSYYGGMKFEESENFRINEIYEKYPHIQTLVLPSGTFHHEHYNKWK